MKSFDTLVRKRRQGRKQQRKEALLVESASKFQRKHRKTMKLSFGGHELHWFVNYSHAVSDKCQSESRSQTTTKISKTIYHKK